MVDKLSRFLPNAQKFTNNYTIYGDSYLQCLDLLPAVISVHFLSFFVAAGPDFRPKTTQPVSEKSAPALPVISGNARLPGNLALRARIW